ncbi:N-acetyl-gamma-glutamyl-phosphate reductase [Caulobacter sp. 17J80-11]|uniref:N-acetyl-gamma-glutamyl-phosphate reductase n=1 Tax=Caulobacter sp. 17J80-11 TaxID=2763502 RepID=UPI001653CAA2|nr:N-acetyl-gamma-glutamyl-phosphate reductase [Caulobacter sp. 17J80-11]MBC6980847.1 N-acetyl-gamma-glutamyl-phosphate reductase [Caulobacter sp. 17J80-11]
MSHKVFIDGEAGTTGLQIRARLEGRTDLQLISLPAERRKDASARAEALNAADAVVLCLPDDAAREAVSLIANAATRVIDASTAHRTAEGWTYGFAEMAPGQRAAIAASTRISNPGCYPTGMIALVRPLVAAGLLPADWPVTVNAVSGYSGGGKAMIAEFEDASSPAYTTAAFRIYATALGHKHVGEMRQHTGLTRAPLFAPAVGRYAQGMIVEVPLQLSAMTGAPSVAQVREVLTAAYEGERFVSVATAEETAATRTLDPEGLNDTNRLKLFVFGDEAAGQARLVALLDNLGKGASGAAVQNLNLALGLDEGLGLE